MMNHGAFGQFQRGNSYNQGRNASSCPQLQQRSNASCNQGTQRSSNACNQGTQRSSNACNQGTQCSSNTCNQASQRSSNTSNQMPTCTPSSCNQQTRQASSCNQSQGRSSRRPVGPSCPCNEMNREQLLNWISLTKFACIDASLYLDTHPCDVEAIEYFKEHIRLYNEAMKEYARNYGPLTLAHAHHCDTYWDWVNQPWPWQ